MPSYQSPYDNENNVRPQTIQTRRQSGRRIPSLFDGPKNALDPLI